MIQIEKTQTIQVDDVLLDVANCSDQIKQLVVYLDDWRQKEVDLTSELLLVRAGLNDLRNSMIQQLQNEAQAKQAAKEEVSEKVNTDEASDVTFVDQPRPIKKRKAK